MESLILVNYIAHNRRIVGPYLHTIDLNDKAFSSNCNFTHFEILSNVCATLKNSTHANNWQFNSSRIAIINDVYTRLNLENTITKTEFFDYLSMFLPSDALHVSSVKFYNLINGIELIK